MPTSAYLNILNPSNNATEGETFTVSGTAGALESEHIDPISVQRENMRNPSTGQSPIPAGRGSAIDEAQPTVMLRKATADAKTRMDKTVIGRVKAESRGGGVTQATANQLGPDAGLERITRAAQSTGTTVPAGAHAAAVGQTDALHADPDVRSFSRARVNNPLTGASDLEISGAVDAPLTGNGQSVGSLTSLSATRNSQAKTLFKGSYSEVPAPIDFEGTSTLDPAPTVQNGIAGIALSLAPDLAQRGARALGASDRTTEAAGFMASVYSGAIMGAIAGLPADGIGAGPGALIGGAIGGVGYLTRNYELCVPFYSCD